MATDEEEDGEEDGEERGEGRRKKETGEKDKKRRKIVLVHIGAIVRLRQ